MENKVAVIAVGGNSLILDKTKTSMADQMVAVEETCRHLADMVQEGWTIVVTHGNGPQVGFGLRRCEMSQTEVPMMPLDGIGAETQGNIGYMIQQCLKNELKRRGVDKDVVSVITQSEVDAKDPAFQNPTKPIGSFMDEAEAKKHEAEDGWVIVEDAGRGWRRVVASPIPTKIVEEPVLKQLVDNGVLVVSTGGGGIPVVKDEQGCYKGVAAVIDKDFGSALLAAAIDADLFMISTAVPRVCLNFNKPDQKELDVCTVEEIKQYDAEGHFAKGSMAPKINAVLNYMNWGGKEAIITCPEEIVKALKGESGTKIVK